MKLNNSFLPLQLSQVPNPKAKHNKLEHPTALKHSNKHRFEKEFITTDISEHYMIKGKKQYSNSMWGEFVLFGAIHVLCTQGWRSDLI
jgi:hypothetical protein